MQLAGAMAREDLRRYGEDALTQAQERRRAADVAAAAGGSARRRRIGPYLRRSCNSDTIAACAVFEGGELVAQAGVPLPWDGDRRVGGRAGRALSRRRRRRRRYAVLGASAQVGGATERRLYVARLLDEKLAQTLSERVGVEMRLINYRAFVEDKQRRRLHAAAFGRPLGRTFRGARASTISSCTRRAFRCSPRPARRSRCSRRGCPPARSTRRSAAWCKRLLVTAIVLAALAVLAGVILGQQVTGPVQHADRRGRTARPRRFLDVDSGRRHARRSASSRARWRTCATISSS